MSAGIPAPRTAWFALGWGQPTFNIVNLMYLISLMYYCTYLPYSIYLINMEGGHRGANAPDFPSKAAPSFFHPAAKHRSIMT